MKTLVKTKRRKLLVFAFIIVVFLIIGNLPVVRDHLTMEWVNAQLSSLDEFSNRSYGPALFVLGTVIIILLQIPGVVPVIVAALVYGLAEAFILGMIGVNIGMIVTFLVARYFLRDYFAPKLEKNRLNRFTRHLETNGILAMSLLRVVLWMFPPLNWFIGCTNIKVRDYIIGNIIGLAPIIFAIQLVTKKLQSIDSVRELAQPESIAVVFAAIASLLVFAWIRKRYFSTKEPQFHEDA